MKNLARRDTDMGAASITYAMSLKVHFPGKFQCPENCTQFQVVSLLGWLCPPWGITMFTLFFLRLKLPGWAALWLGGC